MLLMHTMDGIHVYVFYGVHTYTYINTRYKHIGMLVIVVVVVVVVVELYVHYVSQYKTLDTSKKNPAPN